MSSGDKFGVRRNRKDTGNGGGKKDGSNCPEIQDHYIYPLDHLNIMVKCMKMGLK